MVRSNPDAGWKRFLLELFKVDLSEFRRWISAPAAASSACCWCDGCLQRLCLYPPDHNSSQSLLISCHILIPLIMQICWVEPADSLTNTSQVERGWARGWRKRRKGGKWAFTESINVWSADMESRSCSRSTRRGPSDGVTQATSSTCYSEEVGFQTPASVSVAAKPCFSPNHRWRNKLSNQASSFRRDENNKQVNCWSNSKGDVMS